MLSMRQISHMFFPDISIYDQNSTTWLLWICQLQVFNEKLVEKILELAALRLQTRVIKL